MKVLKNLVFLLLLTATLKTQPIDAMVEKWNKFVTWSGLSTKFLSTQPQAIKTYIKPIQKDFVTKTTPIPVKEEPVTLKEYKQLIVQSSSLTGTALKNTGKYTPINQSALVKIHKPVDSEKTKFMNMVQEALVQSKKSQKTTPAITPTPTLPQLTMSMVHLTRFLDGYVTLAPKDPNAKTYTVTYKNRVYTSTYNPEQKKWVATKENQMSYLTYYEYLLDTDKEALEGFIDRLIDEIIAHYPSRFNLPGKKAAKSPQKNWVRSILKQALLQEQKLNNKYVFYEGYGGRREFYTDFVRAVHKYLDLNASIIDSTLERSRFEGLTIYKGSEQFLREEWDNKIKFGGDHTLSYALGPKNISLLGNIDLGGECSCNYFFKNYNNIEGNAPLIFAKKLSDFIGINAEKYEKLYDKYARLGGKLKQTFVSDPNEISYISVAFGVPKYRITPEKKNLEKTCGYTTSEIINNIRTRPTERACRWDREEDYYLANSIDTLQARFVKTTPPFMDPKAAQEIGLENFYYYADEADKKTHEQLKKEMDELIKNLIYDALKKNSLKIKGTKIQELYSAMEKPVAKEPTGLIKE